MRLRPRFFTILLLAAPLAAADISWLHLSSAKGDLPVPAGSRQQTAALVADLDQDGVQDFVIGFRLHGPALVWYRRRGNGWVQSVLEPDYLPIEAGGAAHDIDGDGDPDLVFGADARGRQLWWWENPAPQFGARWPRRTIKDSGANQHHDQIFADVQGIGRPQLLFWNQRAKALLLAALPPDPRSVSSWPTEAIFSGEAGEGVSQAASYAEGLDAFDVDQDGRKDLLAGNCWLRSEGGGKFRPVRISPTAGRIRAGRFRPGRLAQIVIAPGDGTGPLMLYACDANPLDAGCWKGSNLLLQDLVHGHTLEVGDVNGDGHLDIFAAEMAQWSNASAPDHPQARSWLLFGDGRAGFRKTVFTTGHGWHEGRLADLDGDGDLDILNKPYTWTAPRVDVWLNNGTARRERAGQR